MQLPASAPGRLLRWTRNSSDSIAPPCDCSPPSGCAMVALGLLGVHSAETDSGAATTPASTVSAGSDAFDRIEDLTGEQRGNGVAQLRLNAGARADEFEVIGKGEQPLDLRDTQPPVVSSGKARRSGRAGPGWWARACSGSSFSRNDQYRLRHSNFGSAMAAFGWCSAGSSRRAGCQRAVGRTDRGVPLQVRDRTPDPRVPHPR